jgi:hypothetical protein
MTSVCGTARSRGKTEMNNPFVRKTKSPSFLLTRGDFSTGDSDLEHYQSASLLLGFASYVSLSPLYFGLIYFQLRGDCVNVEL